MGFKVRSKYEDIVAWIQSDPPGVPYPKNRKALQLLDSHVYAQLTAALSTDATLTVADNLYRRGGGSGGGLNDRKPQSTQSVPSTQSLNSAPEPPSSQFPSEAKLQMSVHPCPNACRARHTTRARAKPNVCICPGITNYRNSTVL